jgi:hypothetical protein
MSFSWGFPVEKSKKLITYGFLSRRVRSESNGSSRSGRRSRSSGGAKRVLNEDRSHFEKITIEAS